jgi:molecular chaperone Hsp33
VEQTLISLGKMELQELLETDGSAEVVCHFCNEAYTFGYNDLEKMISQL